MRLVPAGVGSLILPAGQHHHAAVMTPSGSGATSHGWFVCTAQRSSGNRANRTKASNLDRPVDEGVSTYPKALLHQVKVEGVLTMHQSSNADPQEPENCHNRAFEGLLRGVWVGRCTSSGGPNAQCNSARQAGLERGLSGTLPPWRPTVSDHVPVSAARRAGHQIPGPVRQSQRPNTGVALRKLRVELSDQLRQPTASIFRAG